MGIVLLFAAVEKWPERVSDIWLETRDIEKIRLLNDIIQITTWPNY